MAGERGEAHAGPWSEPRYARRMQLAGIAGALGVSLWTTVYQSLYGSPSFALFGAACALVLAALGALVWAGLRWRPMGQVLVGAMYVTTFGIAVATGGRWPGGLYLTPLVPALAVLLVGRRKSVGWAVLTIASIGGLALASSEGVSSPVVVDAEAALAAQFRLSIILCLVIGAMAYAYDSAQEARERELRAANAALRASEDRFRSIAEFATDMILELDPSGRVLFANRQIHESLGWSSERLLRLQGLDDIHPDDRPLAAHALAPLREKGAVRLPAVRVRHDNGSWRWIEIAVRMYERESGERRTVAIARDVTDRRELERELVKREALAAVGSVTAGMAHQVTNPLSSILANAQLARRALRAGQDIDDLLDHIEREAHRGGDITRQLLRFSRGDPTERRIESVHDLARRAVAATRAFAADHGATVELVVDTVEARVEVSAIAIEQAVVNLVHNGIEAASGAPAVVTVTTVSTPHTASIVVSDNGRGLRVDDPELLFEPFYTTRSGGGGSGLGLSVARRAVEDDGGTLVAQARARAGARFEIRLPAVADPPGETTSADALAKEA